MESRRKWKGWKNLEGAGLREMEIEGGVRGKEWKKVRWLPPKVFFLTFLWFYDILTVFSRREQKERNRKCSYSLMKIAR